MRNSNVYTTRNAEVVRLADIPVLPFDTFRRTIVEEQRERHRLVGLLGRPLPDGGCRLMAALAVPTEGNIELLAADVGDSYPSLTEECPSAHLFEREIAEQLGVKPVGHPWLKAIRFHHSYVPGRDAWDRPAGKAIEPGVTNYFRVEGNEIHEVAVGPVHAGVIEPGHFRFQCNGEQVIHLEISLGYQHRGVERALVGGPHKRSISYMETLAGDTTAGHTLAYAQAVEALMHHEAQPRRQAIRAIALELERLANHCGDLGALANDVGYLPTAAYCGRIRGDFLNMTAIICGSRLGRGIIRPGGSVFDLDQERAEDLLSRLEKARKDTTVAVELFLRIPTVLARFEETGILSAEVCADLGLVGPVARASGIEHDTRQDFPSGIYCFANLPISTYETGDVLARAYVRWLEMQRSIDFIQEQVHALPSVDTAAGVLSQPNCIPQDGLEANSLVVSLVEGWRGEICHIAATGGDGHFDWYKVIDPSFHNWMGLAVALRGQQISDFPLCNKSFNLSYCGHDL